MLEVGDHIVHNTFGKGEVISIADYGEGCVYLEIHFEKDRKDHNRMFTFDSIKPHMV